MDPFGFGGGDNDPGGFDPLAALRTLVVIGVIGTVASAALEIATLHPGFDEPQEIVDAKRAPTPSPPTLVERAAIAQQTSDAWREDDPPPVHRTAHTH